MENRPTLHSEIVLRRHIRLSMQLCARYISYAMERGEREMVDGRNESKGEKNSIAKCNEINFM